MKVSGRAFFNSGEWCVTPDRVLTSSELARLDTLAPDPSKGASVELNFIDPRQANAQQRRLFFALLSDIHRWSGEPPGWLKDYFYLQYSIKYEGKTISLANDTDSTVTDATNLIDLLVDFILDYEVPVKDGYELLPRDEEYFQYTCIKHRSCLICGRHADIHHVEGIYHNTIGMGGNRNKVDHSKRYLVPLCREHHNLVHQMGTTAFCKKFKLTRLGIKVDADTLKKIGVQGNYESEVKS